MRDSLISRLFTIVNQVMLLEEDPKAPIFELLLYPITKVMKMSVGRFKVLDSFCALSHCGGGCHYRIA